MKTTAYCNTKICRDYKSFRLVPETMQLSDLMYRCEDCKEIKTYDYVHIMQKGSLEAKLMKELTK